MARIFLTEKEAEDWGLIPKKSDKKVFKQKVLIRVVAGILVLALAGIISMAGPGVVALAGG
jgi:hypothetical protein